MAEVAQGVVALIPSARGFSDLLHKEIGGGLTKAGEKGGEAYGKGMKGKVSGLAKGVFAPMLAAGSTVAIAGLLKSSVSEAREAQKVGAITDQIIKSTGGAAKVTSDQVGALSEKLSAKSGVDDEVIQSGANMLLTFKQVRNEVGKGNDIFDRATAAASDLSAAGFGDMAGQSKMLGKALNDPIKGMTALTRSGVTFTDQQKAQIKAMQKGGLDNAFGAMGMEVTNKELEKLAKDEFGGDIAKAVGSLQKGWSTAKKKRFDYYSEGGHQLDAQKVLLKEVESQVGGTAAAQATAGEKAQVAWGNLQETIGTGLLPVIDKMQNVFTTKIAPAVSGFVQGMQDGSGAGGTFVDVLTKVKNIVTAIGGFLIEHRKSVLAIVAAYAAFKVAAATMRLFNAVVLFGKGVQQGYALATYGSTAATKAGTAAEKIGLIVGKAKLVMMKAVTIATKAWAVAQRLLNAVMRMNPIGLVVTALIALGAGLVLAYKKSETFRRIVDAAWAGVKKAAKVVVDWWTGTAWPAIKKFFTNIGTSMVSAKNRIVGAWDSIKAKVVAVKDWITNVAWPALKTTLYKLSGFIPVVAIYRNWDKITGKFRAAWNWVKGTFSTWWAGIKLIFTNPIESAKTVVTRLLGATGLRKPLTAVWTWVRDTFKKSWAGIKKIFTDPISSARTIIQRILGATGLQKTFQSARDALGRIWGGLKKKLTSPMVSVLKWMNSSFIKKLNGMLGKIKVPFRIPEIGVPKGFAAGGWTGPGSKYQPAGVVHADEYVVNKRSRGKFERDNPGVLDHINATGRMPGYAIGGKVSNLDPNFLKQLSLFNAAAGGRYSVYSGYRSNAHQQILYNKYLAGNGPVAARPGSSQHNKGLAADLAPSNARDVHGALAKQFGLAFTVPSESWHIEPSNGRSGGGGGGFSLGSLIPEWVKDTAGWLKKKFANATAGFSKDKFGLAGEMVPPVFTAMKDAVKKRAMSAASVFGIGGGGSGGGSFDFSKIKGATNMALGQGMAAAMGWKGAQWTALKELWRRESGWNHLAKNPSSGAYGIPQALPASKMASVMQGGGSDYLTNPRTQMSWGLRYIQGRYRNPAAALAFHDRMNWYADGGQVTPPVFDNGGVLAPGLNLVNNKLGRPEALVRPEQFGFGKDGIIRATFVDHDGLLLGTIDGRIDDYQADVRRVARMGA